MTTFFVPGVPTPQGSKKYMGHRKGKPLLLESAKGLPNWRKAVRQAAHEHLSRDAALYPNQAMHLDLEFVMPRPKYAIGKFLPAVKRPDLDKLVRAVLDSLSKVLYGDDNQVTDMRVGKHLAGPDETVGVHITYRLDVRHLDGAEEVVA